MRILLGAFLGATALATLAEPVAAQALVELEGRITQIRRPTLAEGATCAPRATSVMMSVMGIKICVLPGTPIASPTASLDTAQLFSVETLPGRTQKGFRGGTGIVLGTSADGLAGYSITATDVFVEPAENVVLGRVTANGPGGVGLAVEGMPVTMLPPEGDPNSDDRMPGLPVMNAYGFEIDIGQIPTGSGVGIEGYYGSLGAEGQDIDTFHAFLLEADDPTIPTLNPGPEVSVLRASCRDRTDARREIQVRGATHPDGGTVVITGLFSDGTPPQSYGSGDSVPALDGFGEYDFDLQDNGGRCPDQVKVVFGTAEATGPVEQRID